jgi:hypothetical protein
VLSARHELHIALLEGSIHVHDRTCVAAAHSQQPVARAECIMKSNRQPAQTERNRHTAASAEERLKQPGKPLLVEDPRCCQMPMPDSQTPPT